MAAGVTIDFNANLVRFTNSIDKATNDLAKFQTNTARISKNIDKSLSKIGGTVDGIGNSLKGLAASIGIGLAAKQAIQIADTYQNLAGRLKLVTSSAEEFSRIQKELFATSQASRVGYEQTIDLYTRLARATKDLNLGSAATIALTETINQSLVISGASAESAQAALIQFGQGLQSGRFQAEELNSVLEQSPRLAQAIADGLGVAIGGLKKLTKDGKLTSEAVTNSLLSQMATINAEFAKMPVTVGQAITQVQNAIGNLINKSNDSSGAMKTLASTVSTFAKSLGEVSDEQLAALGSGLTAIANAGWGAVKAFEALVKYAGLRSVIETMQQGVKLAGEGKIDLAKFMAADFFQRQEMVDKIFLDEQKKLQNAALKQSAKIRNDFLINSPTQVVSGVDSIMPDGLLASQFKSSSPTSDPRTKEYESYLESLLAKLVPTKAAQDDYNKALKAMVDLKPGLSTAEYAEALQNLDQMLNPATLKLIEHGKAQAAAIDGVKALKEKLQKEEVDSGFYQMFNEPIGPEAGGSDLLLEQIEGYSKAMSDLAVKSKSTAELMDEAFTGWASGMSSTLNEVLWNADSTFSDIFESFAKMLTQMTIQESIVAPLLMAFKSAGGIGGIWGSLTGSAKGNVFNSSGLSAFSNQIVSRPTVFPFAKGMGLMGEAGPEAILPLKRGADGRLGVSGAGGASDIRVEIINKGSDKRVSQASPRFDVRGLVVDIFLDDMESNGPMRQAMGGAV